ncbi:hypothetical protein ACKLK7_28885 [Klebsiella quasipneumoniae subsp. similipneumoniae]|uniref:hypothetical protein n=1 Tax=Klebsiella pneumoniae complex TaxID=3390273 RepID=UPI000B4161BB|nr:hypothetical protein [Klebsiella quasipneumoniae]AZJ06164.1 hypothetical protein BME54_20930 [Klebsiella quasipneumoniae]AZJ29147.1 hypothetical protein BME36_020570 [Klebsiella quasipneumoniae subsp. similipneumoniae]MDH2698303.1 hypothetical protein [Klebsiella quasipneumoniae]OVV93516.1 hypothetical protein BME61_29080 [Klebsiella quasipneumoniae subsp. similipneumoniae]OVW09710.1 hypothetical protein BME58_29070 [Klebsiella quasipneumoniae subsp. similipneumoniae]
MSKQSVKPVLLSEAQIQAIIKIQEKQRQQSGIGVAPTIHEIARGLVDTALAKISAETATRLQE